MLQARSTFLTQIDIFQFDHFWNQWNIVVEGFDSGGVSG